MLNRLFKMQTHISVLTHISSDVAQPSLYLSALNGQKYIFGRLGEGFQRMINEERIKTSKLSGVFLTGQHKWESVSGLPGILLSFVDRNLGLKTIHTGPGLPLQKASASIKSWGNFSLHTQLNIEACGDRYEDETLEIEPITILGDSASFIVQMKPTRGKFMVDKARSLGVPPGELFGRLSEGQSVTVPGTDRVVQPHEVLGPSPVPARVLILDLPTPAHVEAACESAVVNKLLEPTPSTSQSDFDVTAVYYFFEKGVDLESPHVNRLLTSLSGPLTKHFISHPATSPDFNGLKTIAEFQSMFRAEFPKHFSLLYSQPAQNRLPDSLVTSVPGNTVRIVEQNHALSIAPREVDTGASKRKKKAKVEEEMIPNRDPESTRPINGSTYVPCASLSEPEIVTLGTGASAPSKYRNVSGTLVRCKSGTFIFDCGEGTVNTLMRIYGPHGRSSLLQELRVLYISHMHADHHLGAQQLLRLWLYEAAGNASLPKLILAAPRRFHVFIKEWACLDGFEKELFEHVVLLDLDTVCIGKRYSSREPLSSNNVSRFVDEHGLRIVTCSAIHCPDSYNTSITVAATNDSPQFKVSYSGDTRPNRFFAQRVGQNSDLLIHEATHHDELAEEAFKKRHSTIGEALEIARLMKAKNTVLTHISQRYPRLPSLGDTDGKLVGEGQYACFGFDAMHAKLSEIMDIQRMVPRMSELFELLETNDSEGDDEIKS